RAPRNAAAHPAAMRSSAPRDRKSASAPMPRARLARNTTRRRAAGRPASKLDGSRLELALPVGGQHEEEWNARVGPCELVAVGTLSHADDLAGRRSTIGEHGSGHVEIDDRSVVARMGDMLHLHPECV